MNRKLSLLTGLAVAGAVLGPSIASTSMAATQTIPPTVAEPANALVQKADLDDWRYRRYRSYGYNDRCRHWRRECGERGSGGWHYNRCLRRHGC